MLQQLEIENYAVIEKLRVGFHTGLNLLTGETGSGKSILVDAFSLLLGARASPDLIRAGAERARVAGVFELGASPPGIELEDGELLVEREILASGKSRVYLNGRLATVGTLRELAPALGDIHGQHEQQDLFSADTQRDMLDQFAGVGELREQVAESFTAWQDTVRRLDTLRRTEQEKLRLLDLWRFQHQEIAQAGLHPGEDARLEEEKRVLANLARITQGGGAAYEALYDSPSSAAVQIKSAVRALEDLARFDPALGSLAQSLQGARIGVEEAAFELRKHLDRLESNPGRLAEIEDRLALMEKLKRKYGATIEEVVAFGKQVGIQIAEMESGEETARRLEEEERRLEGRYRELAGELSERRRQAARRLEKPVEKELAALAMERTRFEVALASIDPASHGTDRVEFLVSPNPGEPVRPLEQVASGGELSRITLALKTCLVGAGSGPAPRAPRTLVFDEIDAGIGGRAADAVGRRLQRLARRYQVLCVTHLPQIAGFADHHYWVDKQVRAGRTVTTVTELGVDQRIEEMARMLSGAEVTEEAMRHARQWLRSMAVPSEFQ
jgi:DNA repair protein RecN (Recombination protein N)